MLVSDLVMVKVVVNLTSYSILLDCEVEHFFAKLESFSEVSCRLASHVMLLVIVSDLQDKELQYVALNVGIL